MPSGRLWKWESFIVLKCVGTQLEMCETLLYCLIVSRSWRPWPNNHGHNSRNELLLGNDSFIRTIIGENKLEAGNASEAKVPLSSTSKHHMVVVNQLWMTNPQRGNFSPGQASLSARRKIYYSILLMFLSDSTFLSFPTSLICMHDPSLGHDVIEFYDQK